MAKKQASCKCVELDLLEKLAFEGREFDFRRPLEIKIVWDDDVWTYECDEVAIFAYGETQEEARHAFCIEFVSSWDMLANESDDNLTVDARQLKQKLLHCVAQVVGSP